MKKLLPLVGVMLGVAAALVSFTPDVEAQDSDRVEAQDSQRFKAQDYYRLELYEMPGSITTCGSCAHLRDGQGPVYDCLECESGCNCLVGAYTDPATGYVYDGQYFPGVP